jgi:orotidine-5'-phosphate decarboxylase
VDFFGETSIGLFTKEGVMSDRLMVALDEMPKKGALAIVKRLQSVKGVWGFKLADVAVDLSCVTEIRQFGRVFVDWRLYHEPRTVLNFVKNLLAAGADLVSISISAGIEAIRRVVEASYGDKILVSLMPSAADEYHSRIVHARPVEVAHTHLARQAVLAGARGLVLGAAALKKLENHLEFRPLIKVVTGIRPEGNLNMGDHQSIITPSEAIELGADFLIVGRPIVDAIDVIQAAQKIVQEIWEAEKAKTQQKEREEKIIEEILGEEE